MEEEKKVLSARLAKSDVEKLKALIALYRDEANVKLSQSEMVAKLIRDAAEEKGVKIGK